MPFIPRVLLLAFLFKVVQQAESYSVWYLKCIYPHTFHTELVLLMQIHDARTQNQQFRVQISFAEEVPYPLHTKEAEP